MAGYIPGGKPLRHESGNETITGEVREVHWESSGKVLKKVHRASLEIFIELYKIRGKQTH
jgi:hypothetical protein